MKYISKIPDVNIDIKNKMIKEGWKELKEPKSIAAAVLISLPIALLNMCICLAFIRWINADIKIAMDSFINSFTESNTLSFKIKLEYILYIYIYTLIHEIIHLILVPNFIKSKSTFISLKPWGGFVYTEEIIRKKRYLLITIMPFIILSFVVPLIVTVTGMNGMFILVLALINAAGSSVDVLSFILILFQTSKNSKIKNNGMKTFYLSS